MTVKYRSLAFITCSLLLGGCQFLTEKTEEPLYPAASMEDVSLIEEQITTLSQNIDTLTATFQNMRASVTAGETSAASWSADLEQKVAQTENFVEDVTKLLKIAAGEQARRLEEQKKPVAKSSNITAQKAITTTTEDFPLLYKYIGIQGSSYVLDVKHNTQSSCGQKTLALPNNYFYRCQNVGYYFLIDQRQSNENQLFFTVKAVPDEDFTGDNVKTAAQEVTLSQNKSVKPSLYPLSLEYLFPLNEESKKYVIKVSPGLTETCPAKTLSINDIGTYSCGNKHYAFKVMNEKADGRVVVRVVEY